MTHREILRLLVRHLVVVGVYHSLWGKYFDLTRFAKGYDFIVIRRTGYLSDALQFGIGTYISGSEK